jgi:hypothetical protein
MARENAHEYYARKAKVAALLRAIDYVFPSGELLSADEVDRVWSIDTWERLAGMATYLEGETVHPPGKSGETKRLIVKELRAREDREPKSGPQRRIA